VELLKKQLTICALLCLLFSGCSLFRGSGEKEELSLALVLEKDTYLPNEPLLATLSIENTTKEILKIYNFDARSALFYLINEETGKPLEVMPVYSEKEQLLTLTELEPNGKMERKFLFSTITKDIGVYALQSIFDPSPSKEKEKGRPRISSQVRKFSVSGSAPYKRDGKGILLKEDAIEISKKSLGKPVSDAWAKLVRNEAGFYDWWVTLALAEEKDQNTSPVLKAYFVNPYRALVRREAIPFQKLEDKGDKPPVPFKQKDKFTEGMKLNPLIPSIPKEGETKADTKGEKK